MSAIAFGGAKLAIDFADRGVGVATVEIANPLKFLWGMRGRMRCFRLVGMICQGFSGAIKFLVPTHEGRFRNMIASADERDRVLLRRNE